MEYRFSRVTRCAEYEESDLCEGFPLLLSKEATLADLGAVKAQEDWRRHIGPLENYRGGMGPEISYIPAIIPECLPDRLEVMGYANEFGFMHDDLADTGDKQTSSKENNELLDAFKDRNESAEVYQSGKTHIQSHIMLRMLSIDQPSALASIKAGAQFVQSTTNQQDPAAFVSLDEYLDFRVVDFGQMFWQALITFGMGLCIPDNEQSLCTDLCRPAWVAAALSNDLYSWDRELKRAQDLGQLQVMNGLWVLTHKNGSSIEKAKAVCRTTIKDSVARFLQVIQETKSRTDISNDLKVYVEALQYFVSGNLAWSLTCPKYDLKKDFNQQQREWMTAGAPEYLPIREVEKVCFSNDHNEMPSRTQSIHSNGIFNGDAVSKDGPVSNGGQVSNDGQVSNGDALSNGDAVSNGHTVSNGHAVANVHGLPNGHAVSNGHTVSNSNALSNDSASINGNALPNSNGLTDGYAVSNGNTPSNIHGLSNGHALSNGHTIYNGHTMPNGVAAPNRQSKATDKTIHEDVVLCNLTKTTKEVIEAPAQYIKSMPSKGVRSKVVDALNLWLKVPPEPLRIVKDVTDLLHTASLMLDDFQDGSNLRRGKPSTHTIFGAGPTVNSAFFQFVLAVKEIEKLNNPQCREVLLEELENMFVGQSLDLDWTSNLTCPSIDEYLRMVDFKTGGLFRLLAKLMISLSPLASPPNIDRWATLFGRYFQIRDDYQNLTSAEYVAQKGFAEDLDEGKYSLPLIHTLQSLPRHETIVLRNLLTQRRVAGHSPLFEHKTLILELMKRAGSLEFTVRALRRLMVEIEVDMQEIEEQAGENPQLRVMAMLLAI